MGLFKKACCVWKRRVRQKPVSMIQLDMFGDNFNEVLYVRSQEKRPSAKSGQVQAHVFWCSSVDSSSECS